jgi:SAM-dependent methyltransferase
MTVVLNLGCGVRAHPDCVNIDWSIHLRLRKWHLHRLAGDRAASVAALPDTIVVHNLAKGIPAADESVDVVYHSHLIEHIDREAAPAFMEETRRVLRPGGATRIVTPDLEGMARGYLDGFGDERHDVRVGYILEQVVRRQAAGTANQRGLRRFAENLVLGDARRRGETHQWLYDRISLAALLERSGFTNVRVATYDTSEIPEWASINLDANDDGSPYRGGSIYIEGNKAIHGVTTP